MLEARQSSEDHAALEETISGLGSAPSLMAVRAARKTHRMHVKQRDATLQKYTRMCGFPDRLRYAAAEHDRILSWFGSTFPGVCSRCHVRNKSLAKLITSIKVGCYRAFVVGELSCPSTLSRLQIKRRARVARVLNVGFLLLCTTYILLYIIRVRDNKILRSVLIGVG